MNFLRPNKAVIRERLRLKQSDIAGRAPYKALFEAENGDIGLENSYFWQVNPVVALERDEMARNHVR
jgi:hypothetical protein